MTTAKKERVLQVLADIAADMKADSVNFDGQPFNGRTVAEYLGSQGAAIAALADIVRTLVEPPREPRPGFVCENCGHTHEGERFGFICIGCPCERRAVATSVAAVDPVGEQVTG